MTPLSGVLARPMRDERRTGWIFGRTDYERLAVLGERASLLRMRLWTGRRHQIRRLLNTVGHQVLGDTSHGKSRVNAYYREHHGLPRLALHAWRLRLDHPATGAELSIEAPVPPDLLDFLRRLGGWREDLLDCE